METWKQSPKEPRLECSTLGNVREVETKRQVLPKRLLNKMGDEGIAHTFPDGSHFRGTTKCLVWTTFYKLTHGCRHNIIHANNDPHQVPLGRLLVGPQYRDAHATANRLPGESSPEDARSGA